MPRFIKRLLSDGPFLAIFMISLTAVITHGLSIPRLGYYHDDWYMLWSGASRGAQSLVSLFSMDRPFMGVIYSVFYSIIGDRIAGWHIFTLVIRIAGGIAFYWILCLVWPRLKNLFVLSAMLFVVFPGFLAEPNAATKINHLIGYAAALFSIAFTLQAAKTDRKGWKYTCIFLSILLMAVYLWIYEYMIGLEVMRIALLYWVRWSEDRKPTFVLIKNLVIAYIPYILVAAAFLFWRVFIFESTRDATDLRGLVSEYQSNFADMTLRLIFQVIKDFLSSSVFAWFVQPYHLFAKAEHGALAAAFLTAGVVVVIAVGYGFIARKADDASGEHVSPFALVIIGVFSVLAAVFPVVLSNRSLDLMNAYKGYALHPSAGAIIIVIGLVAMMAPKFRKILLISLLALSVAAQTVNIQYWANYWEVQRNLWWQMTWRAPNIQSDTLVMAYLPEGYAYQQDYEIWAPANLIYRPKPENYPPIQSEVLNLDTLLLIQEGRVTDPYVRDIFMPRNYRNLLLISQPTMRSCIHVIDGKMPAYSTSERLIVQKAGQYSNLDRIETSGAAPIPPASIFGQEPEHGWCFYYQQAALARQIGDWSRIGDLYDSTASAGLTPADPSEYFVFIEGLVNLGRLEQADEIVRQAIRQNTELERTLCEGLSTAPEYPEAFGYRLEQINQIVCEPQK